MPYINNYKYIHITYIYYIHYIYIHIYIYTTLYIHIYVCVHDIPQYIHYIFHTCTIFIWQPDLVLPGTRVRSSCSDPPWPSTRWPALRLQLSDEGWCLGGSALRFLCPARSGTQREFKDGFIMNSCGFNHEKFFGFNYEEWLFFTMNNGGNLAIIFHKTVVQKNGRPSKNRWNLGMDWCVICSIPSHMDFYVGWIPKATNSMRWKPKKEPHDIFFMQPDANLFF